MYINGIGRTKFGALSKTLPELAYEAMLTAIQDSSLDIKDIDAIVTANFIGGPLNSQLHFNSQIASLLPGLHIPIIRIETACASSSSAFYAATHMLDKMDNILVLGAEKMTGKTLLTGTESIAMAGDATLDAKQGLIFPAAYALLAQYYLNKYGWTHEILEKISYINHQNGNLNPLAHFQYKEVTYDMIKASPMVADPLNLFDCSPISDGAAAVIISKEKLDDNDVRILSSQTATDTLSLSERQNLTSFGSTKTASQKAYVEAGITPKELDVVEVHDCFTINELIALEDLGICQPGKAPELVQNDEITLTGSIPVNTDGGLKADGHPIGATGLAQIIELVHQIRGDADKRQVSGANIGLAQNIGGIGGTCGITILGGI
ncbi:MAG: thiolase domain-containing protein [Clostridium lundense]|nr:thiolase domain-containing protein [Clostridium lundense]MBE6515640.1 thiolase domain-containing protein [Methanocorpusculum parvum]